jgi:hypothetical protein
MGMLVAAAVAAAMLKANATRAPFMIFAAEDRRLH